MRLNGHGQSIALDLIKTPRHEREFVFGVVILQITTHADALHRNVCGQRRHADENLSDQLCELLTQPVPRRILGEGQKLIEQGTGSISTEF
jgi:hypothetical protein